MKAELFVHTGSQDMAPMIRRLIAEEIDVELPIEVNSVDTGRIAQNLKIGTRYSQLLQGAIPPELGLSLSVSWLSWLGERIYLQVYWPVITAGSEKKYDPTVVSFFPHTFDNFFPALAVRDRMVLVPLGQAKSLGAVQGVTRIHSVLQDDIIEIDYGNEKAVRCALRTVAQGLSAQLQQELTAWASLQPSGELDIRAASRDLDVDMAQMRRILADRLDRIRAPYQRLSCQLDKTKLVHGRWTRVRLTVTNLSSEEMTGVVLDIAGPVEILPPRVEVNLPADTAIEIPLALKPVDEGEFPIEITLVQPQHAPFRAWLPPSNLWLESDGGSG